MVLEILEQLLGSCPPGLEFLYYIFGFVIVSVGAYLIIQIAQLPISFIIQMFRKK